MKLLLVEDEVKAVEALRKGLMENHFKVDIAYDGESGLALATSHSYDVIISDVIVPKLNGFEMVRKIRQNANTTPIL